MKTKKWSRLALNLLICALILLCFFPATVKARVITSPDSELIYNGNQYVHANGCAIVIEEDGVYWDTNCDGVKDDGDERLCDATKSTSIFGGTKKGDCSGSVKITMNGGTVRSLQGGCREAGTTLTGDVDITVNGGSVDYTVFGAGQDSSLDGNATITINGGNIDRVRCTGEFRGGNITGEVSVFIHGGKIYEVGSACENEIGGDFTLEMTAGEVKNLYGLSYEGVVKGDVSIRATGGKIKNIYYYRGECSCDEMTIFTDENVEVERLGTFNDFLEETAGTVNVCSVTVLDPNGCEFMESPDTEADNFLAYDNQNHKWIVNGNATIPAGDTVTIPEGATLTIYEDATLTNHGTIVMNGKFENNGTLNGNGTKICNSHTYVNSICAFCNAPCPHTKWNDPTCILPKTCDACGKTEGKELGHSLRYDFEQNTTDVLLETCGRCDHAAKAMLTTEDKTYTGAAITNAADIRYDDGWLGTNKPTGISYKNNINAGTANASITVEGKELTKAFIINPASLDSASLTLEYYSTPYNGTNQRPACTATLDGFGTLTPDRDYEVFYLQAAEVKNGVPTKWEGDGLQGTDPACIVPGYYGVFIRGGNSGNFAVSSGNELGAYAVYTIDKLNLTANLFTIELPQDPVYNGSEHKVNVSVAEGIAGVGDITVKYNGSAVAPVDAGTYTITIDVAEGDYYNTASDIRLDTFTIGQKQPTLTDPADVKATYGDALCDVELNTAAGDTPGVWSWNQPEAKVGNVGENTFEATFTPDSKNYKTVTRELSVEVSPRDIAETNISLSGEYIYDGNPQETEQLAVSYDMNMLAEDTDYTVSYANNINAGTATVTITGKGNYTGTTTKTFEIQKAAAPIIVFPMVLNPIDYEQPMKEAKLAFYANDYGTFNWAAPDAYPDGVGIKDYALDFYPNELALNNYNWEDCVWDTHGAIWTSRGALCAMGKVTVVPADPEILTHPAAKEWLYMGQEQHLSLVTAGTTEDGTLVYSLEENGEYSHEIPWGTNAGEYTVWYYVQGDANHNDGEKHSVKVTIGKANPTILTHPVAKKWFYMGQQQYLSLVTAGTTEDGTLVYSLEENGEYSHAIPRGTNAGEYTVWYYVQGDASHNDGEKHSVQVTIDKAKPLYMDFRVRLPEDTVYNGQPKEIAIEKIYSEMGAVTVKYYSDGTLLEGAPVDVGTYTFTLDVAESDNFAAASGLADTIRDIGVTFTIHPREVTVTAKDQTITWGTAISDTEIAADGLAERDTVSGTLTPSTENVTMDGSIELTDVKILAEGEDVSKNYIITVVSPAKLVIEPDTSGIEDLKEENVTSDDAEDIQAVLDMLESADSLEEDWEKLAEDCEAMLEAVQKAHGAVDTDEIDKAIEITREDVKPSDKADLEKAKEDLEKALEDYEGNYTQQEREIIEKAIQQIEDALETLEHAEKVEDAIAELPKTVEPDDEETVAKIEAAQMAYDALTDYEKTLVSKEVKQKLDKLTAAAVAYEIVKGDGGKWTKGSISGLTFTANGALSKFEGVEVDGKAVDESDYKVKSGSTIITLKASYLKKLSDGEHKITVIYNNGKAEGVFNIQPKAITPATGDNAHVVLWGCVMLISVAAVSALLAAQKKRRSVK